MEFIASVCDAGHPPHTGCVWEKCGSESSIDSLSGKRLFSVSESDLIHYNKNDKTFCAGGPRASKQMLLANKIFSIKGCCIAVLRLPHGVHIETSLLKFTSYLLY